MGCWYNCTECGSKLYSVGSLDFGNKHFCEPCADKLGLCDALEPLEESCMIDFCDPRENLGLYLEQLELDKTRYDTFYHTLKCEQLK